LLSPRLPEILCCVSRLIVVWVCALGGLLALSILFNPVLLRRW